MAFISISFRFLVPLGSISIHVFSDCWICICCNAVTRPLPVVKLKWRNSCSDKRVFYRLVLPISNHWGTWDFISFPWTWRWSPYHQSWLIRTILLEWLAEIWLKWVRSAFYIGLEWCATRKWAESLGFIFLLRLLNSVSGCWWRIPFVTVNLVAYISVSSRFHVPLGSISIHVFSDWLIVEFA